MGVATTGKGYDMRGQRTRTRANDVRGDKVAFALATLYRDGLAKRLFTFVDEQGQMYKVLRYAWKKPRNAF
jgi:hypothetical protein